MIDGFLGTRASFMLDVVFLAMFLVLPVLAVSVWLAKFRRNYLWHKRLQLSLAVILLAAVAAFEFDIRYSEYQGHPWSERAFVPPATAPASLVYNVLYVHLFFAVTTSVLWVYVIVEALRKFDRIPAPNAHSPAHIFWARLAALDMVLTGCTGWLFYYLAFVA